MVSPNWAVAKRPAGAVTVRIPMIAVSLGTPSWTAAARAQAALLMLNAPGTWSRGSSTAPAGSMIRPSTTR